MSTSLPVLVVLLAALGVRAAASMSSSFDLFPKRSNVDAALLEWGHSAVIHAADAVIAKFGLQADQEEFVLGVEAAPVIAKPSQGCESLRNGNRFHSQMAFMMRGGCDIKTKVDNAVAAGAVALVIINHDQTRPDHAFALETPASAAGEVPWNPQIPCVMVSWNSGQAILEDKPERLRLYPGGGRPFIEGVSDVAPVVYLIHNMLTDEECDWLKAVAEPKLQLHEGIDALTRASHKFKTATLYDGVWKGSLAQGIDERVFSIIGFPTNYFSDLQINLFELGGRYDAHFDWLPSSFEERVMTVVYCLDTVAPDDGGGMLFPRGPLHVQPQKGMAIVYHNSMEDGTLDRDSIHAHDTLLNGTKWTANQWIFATPVPFARRAVLPTLVKLAGGTLPRWALSYMKWCATFGADKGYHLVNYTLNAVAVLAALPLLFLLGLLVANSLRKPTPPPRKSRGASQPRRKRD